MGEKMVIDSAGKDPLFGWKPEAIKRYCNEKPLVSGDHMILYTPHEGRHEYRLATVAESHTGARGLVTLSIHAACGSARFYRTGNSLKCAGGKCYMLPPISELMPALLAEYTEDEVMAS
jgi:hypothetical protein